MKKSKKGLTRRNIAFRITVTALAAAMMICGKEALASLPNIEVVTLLTAVFGYCFGVEGIVASLIFVSVEPLIYGFNTWVISYYLYWPSVALVFMILGRIKVKNRFALTGVAVLMTFGFGVLTSLVDIGLFMGRFDNFFYRFSVMYMRGIPFFVVHIVCNAVLFLLLFKFLASKIEQIKNKSIHPKS